MQTISRKKLILIFQSITIIFLVYSLLKPYFQVDDTIKQNNNNNNATIKISQLSILEESSINDIIPSLSTNSVANNDLTGQNLELDRAHSLQIKMYSERDFLSEQYSFVPSEKVFLVMEFNQLEAGDHNLSTLWKAPNGQLINSSRHTISLTEKSMKRRSYFWLKLMKNGVFTEMLTGNKYKGDIHGRWDAEIYYDGTRIATQHFLIFE